MTRGGHHHAWLRCYSSCLVFVYIAIHQLEGSGRRGGGGCSTTVLVFIDLQACLPADYPIFGLVAILRMHYIHFDCQKKTRKQCMEFRRLSRKCQDAGRTGVAQGSS